jgi:colicin import membrane protein
VVIAKKTVKKKPKETPKTQRPSSSKLIEEALSKIEKKVKAEKKPRPDPVDRAIAKIESKVKAGTGEVSRGGVAQTSVRMQLYRSEVESRIKENWSYPALLSPDKEKGLEAVVLLEVKSDGKILRSRIQKKSSDVLFDQSVIRAIERSDPLPAFPEGYLKTREDMVITFNLRDLES